VNGKPPYKCCTIVSRFLRGLFLLRSLGKLELLEMFRKRLTMLSISTIQDEVFAIDCFFCNVKLYGLQGKGLCCMILGHPPPQIVTSGIHCQLFWVFCCSIFTHPLGWIVPNGYGINSISCMDGWILSTQSPGVW